MLQELKVVSGNHFSERELKIIIKLVFTKSTKLREEVMCHRDRLLPLNINSCIRNSKKGKGCVLLLHGRKNGLVT